MSQKEADQAKRKMLMFLIFAPGIFFLVYWLYTQTTDRVGGQTVELPTQYVMLGQQVYVNGEHYLVKSGQPLFIDTVDLNNNVAVAEPGRVFVGLSLVTGAQVDKTRVQVIDDRGRSYSPLDVEQTVVSNNFKLPDSEGYLYMFKVDSRPEAYYLQVNNDADLTWRFKNTYSKHKPAA
ncbi:hypothetical protein SPSYN_01498 [Sporotomaculum syntrophicum]|uniref:Uncharacterized protein n=1 Tax=Sporotomaculum syntrophicum TaxID=182264 RepID=A0A9D3AXU0_9FIRM|nr:hypothetical protein [Sporotomaculum syntrophicum]KAF1085362.1 hypothetical protein SPSYN_01498 [Sporotomaculum syntrophicum]